MPRPRRTLNAPVQQNPRNLGQNRIASMRANNRTQNAFSSGFQGGVGVGRPTAGETTPQLSQPRQGQCPAGQIGRSGPDGKIQCVPNPNMASNIQGSQVPGQQRQVGAGVPTGNRPNPIKEGY